MKTIKFPKLVIEEAKNLKKYATAEEIANLDINTLDPTSVSRCIYGQMTGDCHSERAIDLIHKCAKRVYHAGDGTPSSSTKLNGSPLKIDRRHAFNLTKYWSPIEVVIDRGFQEMNTQLISFLKGERKTLQ